MGGERSAADEDGDQGAPREGVGQGAFGEAAGRASLAGAPPTAETGTGRVTLGASKYRRVLLVAFALLGLSVILYVVYRGRAVHSGPPAIASLAVLPLQNISGDSTQEYLADGMTEALIGRPRRNPRTCASFPTRR